MCHILRMKRTKQTPVQLPGLNDGFKLVQHSSAGLIYTLNELSKGNPVSFAMLRSRERTKSCVRGFTTIVVFFFLFSGQSVTEVSLRVTKEFVEWEYGLLGPFPFAFQFSCSETFIISRRHRNPQE